MLTYPVLMYPVLIYGRHHQWDTASKSHQSSVQNIRRSPFGRMTRQQTFQETFILSEKYRRPNSVAKPVIGLLQMLPLPGSTGWAGQTEPLLDRVEQEATAMDSAGLSGILLENTLDIPFSKNRLDVAAVVCATQAANRLRQICALPFGLSILQNDPETALAMAMPLNSAFIRVPVLTGTLIAESGMLEGKLFELTALMQHLKIERDHIQFYVDVTMNHVKPAPSSGTPWRAPDQYFNRLIEALTQYDLVDGLIIREQEVTSERLNGFRNVTDRPIIVDTQYCTDINSLDTLYTHADGLILNQCIKKDPIEGLEQRTTVDVRKMEGLISRFSALDAKNSPEPSSQPLAL